ncbi:MULTISPECIES: hypothetical protein [Actinomycetes]|uniref:ATP/GTP-binding protein n=2 Tax=Actinomycetes TaxID=1760 RepID=A0ABP6LYT4_9MICC|nr:MULTISPECIES: hypothetical protein [unclassified Nesterenkonia]MDS2172571.1 hypothetical protein [Nesterenkonia sp. CL21]OSM44143.1 hypothetical protein BCY76_003900 [Nesterenkonia sp. PF2B19]
MGKGSRGSRRGGRRGPSKWQQEPRPLDESLLSPGGFAAGRVAKRDGEYHVRRITAAGATKSYVCPGCHHRIEPGTPHVVAWRADSIFGDERAAAERRHWHSHCWRIG